MGHDIVEINPEAKTMSRLHKTVEVRLGAIASGQRSRLILVAQVEAVESIETDRETSASCLERWWQPKRSVARFRQLWNAFLDFLPAGTEVLQNHLCPHRNYEEKKKEEDARGHRMGYSRINNVIS